jgi:hypothetical protein
MLLVALALLCLATVPLGGGRLGALADLELRLGGLALAALALQVLIVTVLPGGSHGLHAALHVLSYAMGGVFLAVNLRLPGLPLVALGGALNLAAIAANGGVMPADPDALRAAGIDIGAGFANSDALAHPHLAWLGDVIPVPLPPPLANVLSVGDVVLYAGLLVLVHVTCRRRPDAGGDEQTGDLAERQPTRAIQ